MKRTTCYCENKINVEFEEKTKPMYMYVCQLNESVLKQTVCMLSQRMFIWTVFALDSTFMLILCSKRRLTEYMKKMLSNSIFSVFIFEKL